MENFRDRKSASQFTTNHHDSTTNSPSKNHVLPPVFSKTPCKNAKSSLKEKMNGRIKAKPQVSDDETVANTGHPIVVVGVRCGHRPLHCKSSVEMGRLDELQLIR